MLTIYTFGKVGCAKCDSSRRKIEHYIEKLELAECVDYTFYDITEEEGLALAAFMDAAVDIPHTFIWEDLEELDQYNCIAQWHKEVPDKTLKDILVANCCPSDELAVV
jgi:hypothetical protein